MDIDTLLSNLDETAAKTEVHAKVPIPSVFVVRLAADGLREAAAAIRQLRAAVVLHHGQKADDRCILDDDVLYATFGLPAPDRRVGDKAAMLANCSRFIDRRCESGGWPSYVELEAKIERLQAALAEDETNDDD